jgi:lysophospholipase L1-like esterase
MHRSTLVSLLAALTLTACADSPTAPIPGDPSFKKDKHPGNEGSGSEGRGVFHRYVAIGTSISMGVQGDGVYRATQETSWPAQLARLAHRELSLPLITFPGCASPLSAPLAAGVRLSGEPAGLPFLSRQCAPNEPGVTLPAGNVAIDGARTIHALVATPEAPDPGHATQYPRVLPPGMSQVTAMEAQNPKVVSVELGGNDVLGATSGVYLPGVTVVPVAVWAGQYRQVVERVDAAAKHAVLVGLIDDVRDFPSYRSGAELWDARATFAPFNVSVADDCAGSPNQLFVPVRVSVAVGTGAAYRAQGLGPYPLSCANAPSASGIQDYVLGPDDVAALNAQLGAMNAVIRSEAQARGFAYFALGVLYEDAVVKAPFNAVTHMTSAQPYGPFISLDGIHPSAEGARVLADAAARALNATYRLGIPTSSGGAPLLALR